ncbi:hypothetical protein [Enterococcus gilvus]|uniref:Uncharacterized protein n=3 Tax=Enterococcus gilvus ATCC BAA-350 TaxID=1158614 RepID=A0ABN0MBX9_9ENTE|nr:hypothetical protein [Enterococcus gilvus]EOW77162.1 hypothetical protein I592_04138 [Enterococcus gilvus ATCC BAA-350]OJG41109.1 hypothetical protein RV02_GL001196 [Enterococcus gilvus]
MKTVLTNSSDFKKFIRNYVQTGTNRVCTYKGFTQWAENKQVRIVSHSGNGSIGQAIFASVLKHEFAVEVQYQYTTEGQLETVYLVGEEKERKKGSRLVRPEFLVN